MVGHGRPDAGPERVGIRAGESDYHEPLAARIDSQKQRAWLAGFFVALQAHFKSMRPPQRQPAGRDLTPGSDSYRYFEDAYLARYLGYTLVQGRDLAVRRGRVGFKTLGGLIPIEVLWGQITDHQCDPLELDPTSTQGITGLLQAIRRGAVAVANDVGSCLAQTPALLPFLPAAAKFLLDETLSLPTVATYWCGGLTERSHVLANLDRFVIRPAFAVSGSPPIIPAELSAVPKPNWLPRSTIRPHNYVAQPRPARSTTPVWHDQQLRSWYVALRSFQLQASEADRSVARRIGAS